MQLIAMSEQARFRGGATDVPVARSWVCGPESQLTSCIAVGRDLVLLECPQTLSLGSLRRSPLAKAITAGAEAGDLVLAVNGSLQDGNVVGIQAAMAKKAPGVVLRVTVLHNYVEEKTGTRNAGASLLPLDFSVKESLGKHASSSALRAHGRGGGWGSRRVCWSGLSRREGVVVRARVESTARRVTYICHSLRCCGCCCCCCFWNWCCCCWCCCTRRLMQTCCYWRDALLVVIACSQG
jgi:hypothetical protein